MTAWGGIEALCMTAKATRVPIYMAIEHAETGLCSLMKIHCFHEGTPRETWKPLQLPYDAWWGHLAREAVRADGEWPPVLHHLHDHYSSILIGGPPPVTVQATLPDYFR